MKLVDLNKPITELNGLTLNEVFDDTEPLFNSSGTPSGTYDNNTKILNFLGTASGLRFFGITDQTLNWGKVYVRVELLEHRLSNDIGFEVRATGISNETFFPISKHSIVFDANTNVRLRVRNFNSVAVDSDILVYIVRMDQKGIANLTKAQLDNYFALYQSGVEASGFVQKMSKNLFNKSTTTDGFRFSGTASDATQSSVGSFLSDFIPVNPSTNHVISGNNDLTPLRVILFDSNQNYISGLVTTNLTITFTTTSTTAFVRFSTALTVKDTIQLELGTTATTYQAYRPFALAKGIDAVAHGGLTYREIFIDNNLDYEDTHDIDDLYYKTDGNLSSVDNYYYAAGKNLFDNLQPLQENGILSNGTLVDTPPVDITQTRENIISVVGTPPVFNDAGWLTTLYIPVKPSTTYRFMNNNANAAIVIGQYTNNLNWISRIVLTTFNVNFTTSATTSFIRVDPRFLPNATYTSIFFIFEGSSNIPYEVYAPPTNLINLTDLFGAGNEPDKATMDKLFQQYEEAGTVQAQAFIQTAGKDTRVIDAKLPYLNMMSIREVFDANLQGTLGLTHLTSAELDAMFALYEADTLKLSDVFETGNLIENGNFDNNANTFWTPTSSSLSISNGIGSIISTGIGSVPNDPNLQVFNFLPFGVNLYFITKARTLENNTNFFAIGHFSNYIIQNNPIQNQWFELSGIRNYTSAQRTLFVVHNYSNAIAGRVMEVDYAYAINLNTHNLQATTKTFMDDLFKAYNRYKGPLFIDKDGTAYAYVFVSKGD